MGQILCAAGLIAAEPYRQNPLDFEHNQGPRWWLNVHSRYFRFRFKPKQRPLPHITNDKFPNVSVGLRMLFYFLVPMLSWNSSCGMVPTCISHICREGLMTSVECSHDRHHGNRMGPGRYCRTGPSGSHFQMTEKAVRIYPTGVTVRTEFVNSISNSGSSDIA
jgi:hypothetical protein